MRKRLKQIFSAALAGIVMCTAITFYPVETKAAAKAATTDVWEGVSSADWMSGIDGSTKLSAINLPGTHDSTTKNVDNSDYSRCQDKSIAEQLELGIRYLDIRLDGSVESGKLYCVHSSSKCYNDNGDRLDLKEVLDDCYAFLDKHPTETIVMRMKEDYYSKESIGDPALQTAVHDYINKNPRYWYVTNGRPSLDETRGKIVLARYYCHGNVVAAGQAGLNFSGWPDQSGNSASNPPYVLSPPKDNQGIGAASVYVQDWYKLSASNKWKAAQTSLDYAKTITNPDYVYFLNYLSSSGSYGLSKPSSVSSSVNNSFSSYTMEYGANYGWVVMDFATEELAKHVYTSNKSSKLEAITATIDALSMPAAVESDTLLPTTGEAVGGAAGTSITWSSNPANAVSTVGGKFILVRQPFEQNVTLTATVSSGNCSKQKEFQVQVAKLPEDFAELGTVLAEAEAILNNPANAIYDLDSLEAAVETARELLLEDADKVSKTGIDAIKEILDTIMDRELVKSTKKLREHLLAWYPLTANSKDVSGNHNNGVATGVTFSKDGATFKDGGKKQSYISLPTEMFDGREQMTISFWAKDTKSSGSNTVFGFGSGTEPDGNYSANVYKYVLINTNNNRNLKAVITRNTWRDERGFKATECSFPANEWAHITCVFDGTKFALYKNGTLIENKDTGIKLTELGTNTVAYIGNSIWTNNDVDYNGSVKDFRVYDCAIAPELIEEIYNDTDMDVSSDSGHLVARYPLTADSKNVAGKGNDGVATGVTFSPANGATFTDSGKKQSYISLPTAMFDGEEQMTFSFWAKDTKSSGSNTVFGIGSGTKPDDNNTADVYKYVLINTNHTDRSLKAVITKNTHRDERGFKNKECSFPANEWAHITCVFDGTKFTLYKNGTLIGSQDTGIKLTDIGKNTVAYIGNSIWTNNDVDYSGSVKDFRIYDCALSEAEAKGLMNESIKDEVMESLMSALDLDITKGEDGSLSMSITDSITLPTTVSGGTITWNSDKTNVIDNTGKVTLPGADKDIENVTLTATVTINAKTTKITFHCEVFTKLDIPTADLQAILSSVEVTTAELNEADYTASSWKAFQDALDAAKQQIKKPTSEEAVAAAAADLQKKKNEFVELGDKTDLNTLINEVKSLKKAEYTTATWTEFEAALTAAEAAAKSNDVSQDDVDTAKDNLSAKKDALKKRGDKTKLNAAIVEAEALEQEDYTTETWMPFQETLDEVKKTAEDDASEDEVRAAEQSLDAAVKALKKITYTVTFKPDNGSEDIPVTVERKGKVSAPQKPEKDGYIFEGWFAAGADKAFDVENTPIMSNVTLTAKWAVKRTVTFNPDNNTDGWTVEVKDGGKVTKPNTPKKEGYGFVGWYVEGEGTAFDFKNTAITADITLTAKWTEGHTVTFDPGTDDDNDIWTEVVKNGEKVTKPAETPKKAGYEFEYWYAEGEESAFDFEEGITADTTLKAKWTKLYKVTFNPDNDTDDTWIEEVKAGEKVAKPETPEKEDYEFEGWYAEGETAEFDFASTAITADTTLTAKWTKLHTVTFNPDNGTATWTETVKNGKKILMPTKTLEKEGYEFGYWYAEGETAEFDFASTVITEDTTLIAKWIKLYTVTFDPDTDDNNDIWTEEVRAGEKVSKPETPEKEDYEFEGWYAEGETAEFDFANTAITADTTLKAKWTKLHTVTFNPDNGTATWTETVKNGKKILMPTKTLEKEGYEFEGWYAEGANTEFDFANTAITANTTLKAKWTKLYKVTFDPDNDIDDTWEEEVKAGEKVSKPEEIPEKEGYEFEYWYAEDEDTEFDFAHTAITKDITLTAKWTEEQENCVVTFDPDNDIDDTWEEEVKAGEKVSRPGEIPEKEGYEFEYWYAQGEDSEFDFENRVITEDITLTAKWKETPGNATTLKPTASQQGEGKFNVNIPEGFAPDEETDVAIAIPDSLADDIRNCTEEQVFVDVNIPDSLINNENINWTAITLPKEVLEAARDEGKELIITVNGDSSYQWVFTAEELRSATITDANLLVEEDGAEADEVEKQLNDDEEGMVFSFAQAVPGSVIVDTEGMDWKPGDVVNLSYYNSETQRLEKVSGTYTVDANGKVTMKVPKAGSYVLWRKTAENEEPPIIRVKTLNLNAKKLTLGGGEKFTLKVAITPKNATNTKVTWTSSNKNAATVNTKGVITAKKVKKQAKTTITAKVDGKTIKCTVTVKPEPKKIALNAKSKTLKKGKTFQVKVKYTPKNAASYKLTYSIDKKGKKVVSVDSKGKIKAKKKGKATITVTTFNKKKATIKITVK